MAPLRWGIVSCGKISSDFANVLQHLGSDKHVITAVAARSADSAANFAKRFGVSKSYGSYEKLAEDGDIDVIYIGSINTTHVQLTKMYIDAKKPVLCEKPLCLSLQSTKDLISYAKERNVFLMEAMWARCNPVYTNLRERLAKKEIGEVVQANVTFGVQIEHVDRLSRKDLGGGCTFDIGIYGLNFILAAMGDEMPLEVKSVGKLNEEGVDTEVNCVMKFSNNRFASLTLSTSCDLPNEAHVSGTKGTFKICSPFWAATSMTGTTGDFNSPLDSDGGRTYNFMNSQLLKHEAEEVARCLKEGRKESSVVPHELTLKFAELIEKIRTDVGVEI